MLTKVSITISLLLSMCLVAHGWWDQVHITIVEIAKFDMDPKHVEKLESFLARWEYNYPMFGSLTNASTWTDHTRCGFPNTQRCGALPFIDDYSFFNGWHYTNRPHYAEGYTSPEGKIMADAYEHHRWVATGADYALKECIDFFNFTSQHPCDDESCEVQPGYDFSWNFALRMFLHIYGDFHNPCHGGYGVNQHMPEGDDGCTRVRMDKSNFTQSYSLHSYTDSVGDTVLGHMPSGVDPELVVAEAKRYREKYPYNEETFGEEVFNRDPFNIFEISNESHKYHNEIYTHFDFPNYNPNTNDTIQFNETSHEEVITLLEKRLVLAGYRMAKILTYAAESYPDMDLTKFPQMTDPATTPPATTPPATTPPATTPPATTPPATTPPATTPPATTPPATTPPATTPPATTPPTTGEEPEESEEPEETSDSGADVVGIITLVFSMVTTAMAGYIIFTQGRTPNTMKV